ncbi:pentatricopeptide repeat-containing protein At5g67570, chloroplastic isoform X2 [Telopea speciosissima]|uniref:pentatricopeptide repeat-containing protein At5g67570, chloroplastic isoform X2 n=1 Tax=Telopea speciosissima TaxID=54955 RepID=UPI001CC3D520|nr:pentatricopeptide repeat-containing protein At5g67570, chloroplastic isoform X2 [Telopea speciosissima]
MEALTGAPTRIPTSSFEPDTEKIKRKLLRMGVFPTPKIVHTLRKKEIQKSTRQSKSIADKNKALGIENPLSESQRQFIAEEAHFQDIAREYKTINHYFKVKPRAGDKTAVPMVGLPWESSARAALRELVSSSKEYSGEKIKAEHLEELRQILSHRNRSSLRWLLDDDIEEACRSEFEQDRRLPAKRRGGEADAIRFLVDRLSSTDLSMRDWKFSKLMSQSGLQFTERHLLHIVEGLGAVGSWKHALSVVEWVYNRKDNKYRKSRFVFTKLLAVLGKARRTSEALRIFNLMREDSQIYPDMPAYHSIAVSLGQAGLVKELLSVIECMRQKPSRKTKNMRRKNWDPSLKPDLVVYNAVLNACVPSHQWKGVFWVLEQMRGSGLKPNGATYGLAMEVMLQSGKYEHVHNFFEKMKRSGEAPKALTYRVLVRTFWEEGKVGEAIEAVKDMEQRGVVGTASVYYELACCLCNSGRWQDAMVTVEKLKKLPLTKPLEVAFTGMIMSCMDGGHVNDCISIFEHMKEHCAPNIGTINAMLKVYGRNDMFAKAKELFEQAKTTQSCFTTPDAHTYSSMLEASGCAHQWEYFENVYKEMTLSGYQLDQSKQASLLVEASRAGKWHLLEHAFERILDVGEVPHPSLFTEMVCQAIACHNYEKAVGLVNSMTYASFQISEQQWIDVLRRNGDRISKYGLQKMLDTMRKANVVAKATVSNLSKSLDSLCESSASKDTLGVMAFSDAANDELPSQSGEVKLDVSENWNMQNCSVDKVGGGTTLYKYLPDTNTGDESDISVHQTDRDSEDDADTYFLLGSKNCVEKNGSICDKLEESTAGMSSEVGSFRNRNSIYIFHCNSKDSATEMALDLQANQNEVDDSHGTDLPSASEILEGWKESRKNDGICLPLKTWL